ncbi:MAG: gamma-glutamyltransferase [SAR202 cluster bacterium]|jgi:gamma-glutamyltranspeptidase/glutathione hydrolase|nr:gamma-glutamyltransferase [SAR202 cluster bacterium]
MANTRFREGLKAIGPAEYSEGIVASGHPLEAKAGLEILRNGGNAVDAAVASAFVADLAEPAMCGLGAHGVMSIYWAETQKSTVIDFYDLAPAAASTSIYQSIDGQFSEKTKALGYPSVKDDRQFYGHRSVMVPSQVSGLCAAHGLFGSLPLSDLVKPAISLARSGVAVDQIMSRYISLTKHVWQKYPEMGTTFLKEKGELVVRKDLSNTLELIADYGADIFYRGIIADRIIDDMKTHEGILSADDLASYEPIIYDSEQYTYKNCSYVTGGNVTLVEALNILECFDIQPTDRDRLETIHLMIEAMKLSWADTLAYVGDPRRNDSPWEGLTSKDYALIRAKEIDLHRATPFPKIGDPWIFDERQPPEHQAWPLDNSRDRSGNTTKVVTMDRDGNVVSLITSLGTYFGSQVIVPETGVLLNNSMHRLDPRPGYLNSIGPRQGMQRLTASVITFEKDSPSAALAGSLSIFLGGMGFHPLVNMLDFKMDIQGAINAPRFHPVGNEVWVDDQMSSDIISGLQEMGHKLSVKRQRFGNTYFGNHVGISYDRVSGKIYGGMDVLHNNAIQGL